MEQTLKEERKLNCSGCLKVKLLPGSYRLLLLGNVGSTTTVGLRNKQEIDFVNEGILKSNT